MHPRSAIRGLDTGALGPLLRSGEPAAHTGTWVELDTESNRLDMVWRHLCHAMSLGIPIEIGPGAHLVTGPDNLCDRVSVAPERWLTAANTRNVRSADSVHDFARRKRDRFS